MKKLIGIILAVCMLGTLASAAAITDAAATATGSTVYVTYTALADNAQATMLAYKVADDASIEVADSIKYVDEDTTPIVGIDQNASDGTFTFKVADDFEGKIVIKVGGTDVDTPDVVVLADFVKAEEGTVITLSYGDVNGDGEVTGMDASLIIQYSAKLLTNFTDSKEREIPTAVADVNGDGEVTGMDASLVIQYSAKLLDGFTDKYDNPLTTYTYTYVAPEA
ncbi:MAG: hypothetical protein E7415_01165 [Ruminococcaceae bacterium]|nr:hypothetical protein [Oscillospiraceae bacterium]